MLIPFSLLVQYSASSSGMSGQKKNGLSKNRAHIWWVQEKGVKKKKPLGATAPPSLPPIMLPVPAGLTVSTQADVIHS